MRPADASVAILVMCAALVTRPNGGVLAGGPVDSVGDPPEEGRFLEELGPAKVKRNVRKHEEMRVLVSDTGRTLEILPNGAINTTTDWDSSPYGTCSLYQIRTLQQRH